MDIKLCLASLQDPFFPLLWGPARSSGHTWYFSQLLGEGLPETGSAAGAAALSDDTVV